jgi:ABC-type branched-subunit amino acid transport system substrate-binding protein
MSRLLYISLSFLLICFASSNVQAQRNDHEAKYKAAVEMFKKEMYGKVQAEMLPLTSRKYDNATTPYICYLYAAAALRNHQYNDAKNMLRQLLERYPNWEKNDEAYLLIANCHFGLDEFTPAMEYLRRIESENLKLDVKSMEEYFISKISKLETIRNLYAAYPDDRTIAINYADLIMRTSTDKNELELSDRIANRYGVKQTMPDAQPPVTNTTSKRKDNTNKGYFNIGVLFPFEMEVLDADQKSRTNQYALDIYEGIKLAKVALQKEGIIVNLYAYDMANDADKMRELLKNHQFSQMDMLIGPLFAETNKIASEYCNQYKIPLLNPLATNQDLVINQPYIYLGQASLMMKAAKAAAFAQNHFTDRSVAVFYGTSKQDSLLANYYSQFMSQAGYEIVTSAKLPQGYAEAMSMVMPDGKARRIGHVFLAGSSKGTGSSFLSALDKKRITSPVLALADVFNLQAASGELFDNRKVYLIDPDFIDDDKEEAKKFQQLYLSKRNTLPSVYAYQGYDMMLFFGRMLGKYPNGQFKNGVSLQPYTDGYVLSGFDYTEANENQLVPIIKLSDYRWQVVR